LIKLLYFARLREALGTSSESVEPPDEVSNVKALMAWLASRGGEWQMQFDGCRQIRAAINHELVSDDAPIKAGDEVAFFPPVTGG
jgi:molybdopterin synthase sulfur carrier subunit